MPSRMDFCKKLAAAATPAEERAALTERERLPPPERSISLAIRALSDGHAIDANEVASEMIGKIEVVMQCGSDEVIWRPKAAESLLALMRE